MGLNWNTNATMAGRITSPDANYPYASSKDETAPGAGDGTPYFKARADDIAGFQQALLNEAAIVPSGNAETILVSQYRDALKVILGGAGLYQNDIDYPVKSYAKGSDGFVYRCFVANGPTTSVVDPVGDTTGTWKPSEGVGINQTWQDVKASRASGVNYTNTTGKPIEIQVEATATSSGVPVSVTLYVGGVAISAQRTITVSASTHQMRNSITVPDGAVYRAIIEGTLSKWFELR